MRVHSHDKEIDHHREYSIRFSVEKSPGVVNPPGMQCSISVPIKLDARFYLRTLCSDDRTVLRISVSARLGTGSKALGNNKEAQTNFLTPDGYELRPRYKDAASLHP